jgi:hypothetical protein
MFKKDNVVRVIYNGNPRYVQVESGPFEDRNNDNKATYLGWLLLTKNDSNGEPSTFCFVEDEAELATDEEVETNTQGKLSLQEEDWF